MLRKIRIPYWTLTEFVDLSREARNVIITVQALRAHVQCKDIVPFIFKVGYT
jgi:hypothetical protein